MVVLGTRKMGAQTERKAQNKLPQLDNSERCIICYEAHTVTESETGISFELRNLKDIFVRCFDIQFLPKFSEYGPVHMCTRCHEEFSKVEKLYDAVKCTENSFDAAREKLAFLVVDSIFKSGYISNWVHGNAFDAIRCLVFKAWSTKFKKQGQSKKGNNNKNRNNSVNLDENSQSEITATQDTAGSVKNSTDETKISADKTITGEDEKIPPPLTKILPPLTKISPQKNNKSVQKKASTESKTISTEKAGNPDQPPVQEAKVTEGKAQSPSHQLVTSSVDPECEKNSDGPPVLVKQVEDSNEENQSASISSTNVTKESSQSTQSEKTVKKTSKPSPSSVSAKSEAAEDEDLVRKSSIPSSAAEKTQADAPPPLRASIPKPVHPTYMLSPDGKKLMSNTGGVLQNTRLIFVKKDPVTGKMIQVPRPNIGSVKGKLNGKDVIVHTAPNSANSRVQIRPLGVTSTDPLSTITKMIPRSKVSTSSIAVTISKASTDSPPVPKIVSVQSMQNGPQTKPVVSASSPPKLELAVKQKNEPAVKQKSEPAVKQKNEPAVKPKNEPVVKQKSEPDDTKSIEDNKGPQSKQQQQQPAVLEESPEQRSSRSGRRIKRPFESSDWASGHEMNKLLSHSIKVGRHQQHSPNKRQKGDVLKASTPIITSELLDTSDQPEEEEASKE